MKQLIINKYQSLPINQSSIFVRKNQVNGTSVQKYFIYLAYDDTHYHGWQIQLNGISIQECPMKTLATFLRRDTEAIGAGRTDAGVHTSLTVVYFDYEGEVLDTDKVTERLNRLLPQDTSVYRVCRIGPDVYARFDVIARTYKYYIITTKHPFNHQYRYRIHNPPDFQKMNEAALTLFHYTDFTSFSKLHTDVKTNICKIMHAGWTQEDEYTWVFITQADRSLHNTVCAIVGTLSEVGRGKLPVDSFHRAVEQQGHCKAGTSVPGNALFLANVGYSQDIFE